MLGDGQYVAHDGRVRRLYTQDFGHGSSHWIAVVDEKAHVVIPVVPTESARDGMQFEELAWNLISLLLDRMGTSQAALLELKENMKREFVDQGERASEGIRQVRLEVEDSKSALTLANHVLVSRCDSIEEFNRRLKEEVRLLKEENEERKKESATLRSEFSALMASLKGDIESLKKEVAVVKNDKKEREVKEEESRELEQKASMLSLENVVMPVAVNETDPPSPYPSISSAFEPPAMTRYGYKGPEIKRVASEGAHRKASAILHPLTIPLTLFKYPNTVATATGAAYMSQGEKKEFETFCGFESQKVGAVKAQIATMLSLPDASSIRLWDFYSPCQLFLLDENETLSEANIVENNAILVKFQHPIVKKFLFEGPRSLG